MQLNLSQYWSVFEAKLLALNAALDSENIPKDGAYQTLYQLALEMIPIGKAIESLSLSDMYSKGSSLETMRPTFDNKGPGTIEGVASHRLAVLYLEHLELILSGKVVPDSWLIKSVFSAKRIIPETDKKNLMFLLDAYQSTIEATEAESAEASQECPKNDEDDFLKDWYVVTRNVVSKDWYVVYNLGYGHTKVVSEAFLNKQGKIKKYTTPF